MGHYHTNTTTPITIIHKITKHITIIPLQSHTQLSYPQIPNLSLSYQYNHTHYYHTQNYQTYHYHTTTTTPTTIIPTNTKRITIIPIQPNPLLSYTKLPNLSLSYHYNHTHNYHTHKYQTYHHHTNTTTPITIIHKITKHITIMPLQPHPQLSYPKLPNISLSCHYNHTHNYHPHQYQTYHYPTNTTTPITIIHKITKLITIIPLQPHPQLSYPPIPNISLSHQYI